MVDGDGVDGAAFPHEIGGVHDGVSFVLLPLGHGFAVLDSGSLAPQLSFVLVLGVVLLLVLFELVLE